MELTISPADAVIIGATGMEALLQNIRTIVLTSVYSVPLDRGFAHLNALIDSPSPAETIRLAGQLTEAIERYEPRISVERIVFRQTPSEGMEGRLFPHITFRLKDGVSL